MKRIIAYGTFDSLNYSHIIIGNDWFGEFSFSKEESFDIVYLSRNPNIGATQIKYELKSCEQKIQ